MNCRHTKNSLTPWYKRKVSLRPLFPLYSLACIHFQIPHIYIFEHHCLLIPTDRRIHPNGNTVRLQYYEPKEKFLFLRLTEVLFNILIINSTNELLPSPFMPTMAEKFILTPLLCFSDKEKKFAGS